MTTLKAAGYSTAEYVGTNLSDDEEEQAEEEDESAEKEQVNEGDQTSGGVVCHEGAKESFLPSDKGLPYDPLLIFYDCEATGGSIYDDNITSVLKKLGIFTRVETMVDRNKLE